MTVTMTRALHLGTRRMQAIRSRSSESRKSHASCCGFGGMWKWIGREVEVSIQRQAKPLQTPFPLVPSGFGPGSLHGLSSEGLCCSGDMLARHRVCMSLDSAAAWGSPSVFLTRTYAMCRKRIKRSLSFHSAPGQVRTSSQGVVSASPQTR